MERISTIIAKESTISTLEMEQWFTEQYMSDYPGTTRDKAIQWVQSQVYDQEAFIIKPYYILFFLINQGVLKLEDDPNNRIPILPQRALDKIRYIYPRSL